MNNLLKESSDLILKLDDIKWQAAIEGNKTRHDRVNRVYLKALVRHGRRFDAFSNSEVTQR